eukprot:scaffold66078_cov54-Phaeocystis_antarctica.AAC.3
MPPSRRGGATERGNDLRGARRLPREERTVAAAADAHHGRRVASEVVSINRPGEGALRRYGAGGACAKRGDHVWPRALVGVGALDLVRVKVRVRVRARVGVLVGVGALYLTQRGDTGTTTYELLYYLLLTTYSYYSLRYLAQRGDTGGAGRRGVETQRERAEGGERDSVGIARQHGSTQSDLGT